MRILPFVAFGLLIGLCLTGAILSTICGFCAPTPDPATEYRSSVTAHSIRIQPIIEQIDDRITGARTAGARQTLYADLGNDVAQLPALVQEAHALTPPPAMQAFHQEYLSAMDTYGQLAVLYQQNSDPSALQAAFLGPLALGKQHLDTALRELARFDS